MTDTYADSARNHVHGPVSYWDTVTSALNAGQQFGFEQGRRERFIVCPVDVTVASISSWSKFHFSTHDFSAVTKPQVVEILGAITTPRDFLPHLGFRRGYIGEVLGESLVAEAATANPGPARDVMRVFRETWHALRGRLSQRHREAMEAHVARFLGDDSDLIDEGVSPSLRSFNEMLDFLVDHPSARPPAMGVNRLGHFSISWNARAVPDTDVLLTFLGNRAVKWFTYEAGKPGEAASSGTGTVPLKKIGAKLRQNGCDKWMT